MKYYTPIKKNTEDLYELIQNNFCEILLGEKSQAQNITSSRLVFM